LAYALVFGTVFIIYRQPREFIFFLIGGFFSALIIFLVIRAPGAYFSQVIINYALSGHDYFQQRRYLYLLAPINWFRNYYWLIALTVFWACRHAARKLNQEAALFYGLIFIGLFSMLTGSMVHEANVPLQGICCAMAFILIGRTSGAPSQAKEKKRSRWSLLFLLVLASGLIFQSVVYGFQLKVWTYAGTPYGDYALRSEPLRGWMFREGDGRDLDALHDFVKENVPEEETVLVLTDLQILYPLTGRDSFRGVPFIFLVDHLPVPGKQLEQVRQNIMEKPPDWIVTHRLRASFVTFLIHYLELRDFIVSNYTPVKSWDTYAILRRVPQ
jgi:hypothetical protein